MYRARPVAGGARLVRGAGRRGRGRPGCDGHAARAGGRARCPPSDERSFTVLRSVRTFPRLLAFGALYNIGIWSDKVTFWVMDGESVRGILLKHPLYDSCSFLAYATVVPALAINLVRIETSFYPRYRSYYDVIEQGGSLAMIQRAQRWCRHSAIRPLASCACRLGSLAPASCSRPSLLGICGVPDGAAPTFRVLCAGAYFHVLLLLTLLTLLYFDQQRAALRCAALFCLANIALPMLSLLWATCPFWHRLCLGGALRPALRFCPAATHAREARVFTFTR